MEDARIENASIVTGGSFTSSHSQLEPTIITKGDCKKFSNLQVSKEETFGPIVTIEKYHTVDEAIEKANQTEFGLTASVMTKSLSMGEDIANRLQSGTVNINEVSYTAGLTETPWVGVKNSGRGVKHSEWGLLEFTQLKHIHKPRRSSFLMKSLWWYPYSSHQKQVLSSLIDIHSQSWLKKITTLPLLLYHLILFFKKEPRL